MPKQRRQWRRVATFCAVVTGLFALSGVGLPTANAATSTSITVNGNDSGRTYDGIGAASGGGGNSRLLIDYPEAQRNQILDYLFKPGYGANLQLLKIELGGDTNSTDGAEPSYQHTRGTKNCSVGYEFWLAAQAKARNPNIKLLGLAWGAPGWIGNGSFWTQDMIDYYLGWMDCAKNTWGLNIDYLGGWNEKGSNRTWFLNLSTALASKYPNTKIVADDSNISFADKLVSDASYKAAIGVVGTHYPCGWLKVSTTCPSSTNAINLGKPLWASEGGSQNVNTGNAALVRQINRGYLDGKYTAFVHWPLAAALYSNLPFTDVGPLAAQQPWSGNYSVGRTLWTLAQYTQVIQPGWSFIDSASGYLGGNRDNGSYVTLKSANKNAYSSIIETSTATSSQTASFTITGGLPTGTVHVYASSLASNSPSSAQFAKQADITPSDGKFSLTLQPNYVYSLTTTTGQGKGAATPPTAKTMSLPYTDNFDSTAINGEAKYLSDMEGAYEVRSCLGGRSGRCVQQVAPIKPIHWQGASDSFALLGDPSWKDYTVSVDTLMQATGTTFLNGRVNLQQRPQGNEAHYQLRLSNTGAWSLGKNTTGNCSSSQTCSGTFSSLASGTISAPGLNSWHNLAITFAGSKITAKIDSRSLATVTDSSYPSGNVGFGVQGYQQNQWDNLSITTGAGSTPTTPPVTTPPVTTPPSSGDSGALASGLSGICAANSGNSSTDGSPIVVATCDGSAGQKWTYDSSDQTLRTNGKCADITARGTANNSLVELWTCNGGTNQKWQVGSNSSLVNPASGRCLDDPASSRTSGTQLIIWDCDGGANQRWTLPAISA